MPLTFALGLLCMILEGYDTYSVSYVGPALLSLWSLEPARLGVLFTSGVIGSAIGYVAIGPLTSRIGRRMPIIIGTCAFGLATLGSLTASSAEIFMAWRVVTGLALGAVLPHIVSLIAETLPATRRSFAVVVLYSGFGIGSVLAGLVARATLPLYGWKPVLLVGGLAPLLLALVMGWKLPESPLLGTPDSTLRRNPVAALFADGRLLSTVLIWIILTMDGTAIGALVFWIPTLISKTGLTVAAGINFSVVLLLGGIVGAFLIGYAMDRFGVFRVLLPVHLAATVFIALFAAFVATAPIALAALIGMTLNGGTSGVQGLLARLYPAALRTTGIGWASGVSRFVGIGQPLITGLLLSALWPPSLTLLACAVPLLVASTALLILSRDRHGRLAALAPST